MNLLPNFVTYNNCIKFYEHNNFSCSKDYNIFIEEFKRFATDYKYNFTQRKGDGGYSDQVFIDRKNVVLRFRVVGKGRKALYEQVKEIRKFMQPTKYTEQDGQFKPLTFCMPDGEEFTTGAKLISLNDEERGSDGCSVVFSAQFLIGDKDCSNPGCFFGDTTYIQGLQPGTSGNPVPRVVPAGDTPRQEVELRNFYNFTNRSTHIRDHQFFDNYMIVNYEGASCCQPVFTIELTGPISIQGPLVIYVFNSDGTGGAFRIDKQVIDGTFISILGSRSQVYDGMGNDIYGYASLDNPTIHCICPQKKVTNSLGTYTHIIAYDFQNSNPGDAVLSLTCTNTRC